MDVRAHSYIHYICTPSNPIYWKIGFHAGFPTFPFTLGEIHRCARDSLRTKVRSESVLNEYGWIGLPGGFTGVQFSSSELYHVTEIAQDKDEIQTVEKSSLHNFPF